MPTRTRTPVLPQSAGAGSAQVVVCVLGMHRSGTSCLAGTLEEAGVFLGDVFRKNRHNAKGNRENQRIIQFHDAMLADSGGSWDAPPAVVRWSAQHQQRRDDIIASYRAAARWGFKDPRTLLTLAGWLEALPRLRLVGIFRNPVAVAESLHARNGFPLERGLALWTHYNERLLAHQVRLEFPLLSFDRDDDTLRRNLAQALDELDVCPQPPRRSSVATVMRRLRRAPADSDLTFFDPALRHQQSPREATPLPERTARVYQMLNARCM